MKWILLSLLLASCAGSTAAEAEPVVNPKVYPKSPYKVKVFSGEDIHKTVSYFADAFMLLGLGQFQEGWSIALTDQYLVSPQKEGIALADGLTIKEKKLIILFAWQDCLADSALAHEMLHAMGHLHGSKHERVLEMVVPMGITDLCGPGYERKDPPDPTKMDLRGILEYMTGP